jgi:hypothetical protein
MLPGMSLSLASTLIQLNDKTRLSANRKLILRYLR